MKRNKHNGLVDLAMTMDIVTIMFVEMYRSYDEWWYTGYLEDANSVIVKTCIDRVIIETRFDLRYIFFENRIEKKMLNVL